MHRLLLATLVVGTSACTSSSNPSPVTPTPVPTTPGPTPTVSLSVTIGTPSPSTPRVGQVVTFPLTFSVPAGDLIAMVRIDTDGNAASVRSTGIGTGSPSSFSLIYASAGTFVVTVTATDTAGNTAMAVAMVFISQN